MADSHAAPASASDAHVEHPHAAPAVPTTVKDEAGPTPTWVPVVGLVLLAVLAFFAVYRLANPRNPDANGAAALDGAVEAGAAADGGAAPAAERAPQPAR